MSRLLALLCVLTINSLWAVAQEKVKLPAPEEREKSAKLVRDLFKAEYAKTTPAAKLELARKLFQQGEETKDDPASQFVLYKEAAELASGGDVDLALKACTSIATNFEGSVAEMLEPTLKLVVARVSTPDACQSVAMFLLKHGDDLMSANEFDAAERFNKLADNAAQRSKSVRVVKLVTVQAKEVEGCKQNHAKFLAALKTLETNANDAEACLTAGSFYCFLKGDWVRGLPYLSMGADKKLQDLADKDLLTREDNTLAMAAVADRWYDYVATLDTYPRKHVQARTLMLYQRALPALTGLSKTRVEKRIEELEKFVQVAGPDVGDLWALVRVALRDKTYHKTEPMGGAFGDKDYSELHPNGGVLIGFNYTLKKFFDKDLIDCFQPIYLTPSGEKFGPAFGNFRGARMLTLKAKPGYAIGKMAIRGGGLWGGVNVVFMKLEGKGMKTEGSYESGWIGHKDAPDSPFLGDGRPIIGIHGKLQKQADGGGICSIGLFLMGDKPTAPKK